MPSRKRRHSKKPSVSHSGQNSIFSKNPFSRSEIVTPEQQVARDRFRTRTLPVLILLLVSFLAYANAWPNNLTWDDEVFSIGDRLSGIEWADVGRFFTQDVWASIGLDSGLYRPLLLLSVSLDIEIFGHWVAGLHLVNILLHALTTVAVYGLTRYLLVTFNLPFPRASFIALLAALVFAVHPVHTEVVNSIFNRSEMLATLGVAGGLWWFLPSVQTSPWKSWLLMGLIYFLVMLSRETGIVLPGIVAVFLWFTTPGAWQVKLRRCLPVFWLLIPMVIYLGMRAQALEVPMPSIGNLPAVEEVSADGKIPTLGDMSSIGESTSVRETPSADEGPSIGGKSAETRRVAKDAIRIPLLGAYLDTKRLLPAIAVWFDAFRQMVWPYPLLTFHGPSTTNVWLALGAQLALLAFALVRLAQGRPGLFLGLVLFYLAILPSSRIIGEAGIKPHLAERYLYMPSVGATIMLAFGLGWLAEKISLKHTAILTITVLLVLTPLTLLRNASWANTIKLAQADYEQDSTSRQLLQTYISSLLMSNQLTKASDLCDKHVETVKTYWVVASYCGQVYASLGNYDKTEWAFAYALRNRAGMSSTHYALAVMYIRMNRREDAREHFELAVETEQQDFMQEYLKAEGLMRLHPSDRAELSQAKSHLEKTIELRPQYFQARKRLDELNQMLNSLDSQDK